MKKTADFKMKQLNEAVLGHHGIQLLIERKNSFFETAVVGIICIGTKVMYTCNKDPTFKRRRLLKL